MGISAINLTSNPVLLRTYVPLDLFKLRFPDATAVLNTPGAVNTSQPTLLQASLPVDSLPFLHLPTREELGAQATAFPATSAAVGGDTAAETEVAISQAQAAAVQDAVEVNESIAPETPDSMQSMLRGVYLAPVASRFYLAPYQSGLSASVEESMKDVLAPTASFPASEFAQGHPSNTKAYVQHLPVHQFVTETYGAAMQHTLDVVA